MTTELQNRSELKEAVLYVWHVFITSALFSFLILAAVGVEILLRLIKESQYNSEFLMQTLMFGKKTILIIDLGLLIYLLTNHTWKYVRSLPWK